VTDEELDELESALDAFLQPYLFCCGYTQTFGHLRTYCRGLLSDLKRKSAEPIALASSCAVRTMQEFLRDHQWQHSQVRDQLQRDVAAKLAGLPDDSLGNVGLIDETSALKSGTKSPGVQRQYLGCVGKIDNGIVTVHLGVCKGRYKTLIDADCRRTGRRTANAVRRRVSPRIWSIGPKRPSPWKSWIGPSPTRCRWTGLLSLRGTASLRSSSAAWTSGTNGSWVKYPRACPAWQSTAQGGDPTPR
jgi:hypothetical protein